MIDNLILDIPLRARPVGMALVATSGSKVQSKVVDYYSIVQLKAFEYTIFITCIL